MTTIPHNKEPFLDASGLVARSWRTYLSSLTQSDAATQLQRQIDQLRAAIPTESPNGSNSALNAQLLATGSVDVTGTLSSGFVTLSLEGDTRIPEATSYYGTDAAGVKGWHPVPVVSVNGNTGNVLLKVGTLADVDASAIADKKHWCGTPPLTNMCTPISPPVVGAAAQALCALRTSHQPQPP